WEIKTGREIPFSKEELELGHVQMFSIGPDSRTLALARFDDRAGVLKLLNLPTGRLRHQLAVSEWGINSLAFSPDGRTLASGGMDEKIRFYDVAGGTSKGVLEKGVGWVKTVAFSPDGRRIAYGGRDGTVHFHELNGEGLHLTSKGP